MSNHAIRVTAALLATGAVVVGGAAWFLVTGRLGSFYSGQVVAANEAELTAQIQGFCGACHTVPHPEILPRLSWADEIPKAYKRYAASGRHDLTVPVQAAVTQYYTDRALEAFVIPNAPVSSPSPVPFQSETFDLPPDYQGVAVSFLAPENAGTAARPETNLLLCDMLNGSVQRFHWADRKSARLPLARLKHPDHVVPCDFDGDGRRDYLVAELGALQPSDELSGAVELLRATKTPDSWEAIPLQESIGRVADAQVGDLDGDGDNDVAVAEFGFEKAGSLFWLETVSLENGRPKTIRHELDPRHGAIHVPMTDLDHDGDLDLIALFSQEHESIDAFVNNGQGQFERRTLFEARNPSFGSSGLELVDLDQDDDLDLLFTNGDTLDTFQLKPFHAVNWLENRGDGTFQHHQIATLPGVSRAVAADLDNDGDQDIAAVAFCPPMLKHMVKPNAFDTLVWLQQTSPGQFERHSLGGTPTGYMAISAGDFDHDGDNDLAVGEFSPFTPKSRHWLTLHWNQLRPSSTPPGT
jgi:hypothetical protein